jgi:type II secretory pathway pseudopilin PulG
MNQRGDTIVEVLVAIGVLSLILGGAFVLTNRSLQGTRASQERLNATKLVETQLEHIKNLAATDASQLTGAPANFCVNSSGAVRPATDGGCHVTSDGTAAPAGFQPAYNLTVSRTGDTYKVKNTWDSITGDNVESVEMSYRVYE